MFLVKRGLYKSMAASIRLEICHVIILGIEITYKSRLTWVSRLGYVCSGSSTSRVIYLISNLKKCKTDDDGFVSIANVHFCFQGIYTQYLTRGHPCTLSVPNPSLPAATLSRNFILRQIRYYRLSA